MDTHTKFSVWVSFCEIYNENIHDLLEPLPNGAQRRTVLRLSQDIKGNSFIKGAPSIHTRKETSSFKDTCHDGHLVMSLLSVWNVELV